MDLYPKEGVGGQEVLVTGVTLWAVMESLDYVLTLYVVVRICESETCVHQKQAAQTRLMRWSHRCLPGDESMFSGALNIFIFRY